MSALSLAVLLEQQAGLEPVLQYACRDRYLLGMQSDLLGAHATGIRNLLLVTGDPRKRGDYSDATLVFDVDSIGLTNAVARLNRGRDVGGQAIGRPTAFHVGVVGNPTAPRLDDELKRFDYKVEAGAEFAVTVPIFDLAALDAFLERIEHARLPIIAAVRPFDSLRHAEFLANEVPNLRVPEALLTRMRRADAEGRAAEEGLAIAVESGRGLRDRVQGLQVGGPPGRRSCAGRAAGSSSKPCNSCLSGTGPQGIVPRTFSRPSPTWCGRREARRTTRMALFERNRRTTDEDYLASTDAATRALSVTAVETDFVAGVYEKLASVYDFVFGPTLHAGRLQALQRMAISAGDRILEVGVGTGINLSLYPQDCQITGIDLSDSMLEKAHERVAKNDLNNVRLLQMDATSLASPTTPSTSSTRRI